MWVEDQRLIAWNYLTSWFLLDASTIFVPGGFDLSLTAPADSEGNWGGVASDVSVLRTLRVIRLAKLGRLLRASRLYRRWQSRITMSSSSQTVMQCTCLLFIGAHWYACLIGIQTALHERPQDTWLGDARYEYCPDVPPTMPPPQAEAAAEAAAAAAAAIGLAVPVGGGSMLGVPAGNVAGLAFADGVLAALGGSESEMPSELEDGFCSIVRWNWMSCRTQCCGWYDWRTIHSCTPCQG